jgi:MFS family permease
MMKNKLRIFYGSVFFRHFAYGIIIPTLIIWQNRNGLSFTQIAIIQSVGLALLALAEVPSSYFADKWGRKITIILGLISSLLSFGILIFSKNFIGFLLFQSFFNIGSALLSGTEEAFLDDLIDSKKNLTRHLGSMSISDEFGTIAGMLASGIAIKYANIIFSFQIGFSAILASFFLICIIDAEKHIQKTESVGVSDRPWALLFAKLSLASIFPVMAFGLFAERGEMLFQNRFGLLGLSLESLGAIYILGKIFSILGSGFSHILEVKLKTFPILILSAMLQIIAFALLLPESGIIAITALCVFFFSENIFRNVKSSFIIKNSPQERRATNLSLINSGSSVILIFSKLILGWSLDQSIFYAIAFVVLLKIAAVLILDGSRRIFLRSRFYTS